MVIILSGLKTAPDNWLELYAKGWFRFGNTQTEDFVGMALTLNANNLGYYSMIGCFSAFHLWRKGYCRALNLSIIVLHVAAGILAVSRSFLLLATLCVVLMVLISRKSTRGILGFIVGCILASIAISVVALKYPDVLTGWITRMTDKDMSTGNGRVELLLIYLKAWLDMPRCIVLGTGVTGYWDVIGVETSAHNALEQILITYGFLGALVFLYGLIRPVIQIGNERKVEFVDWMPLISLVFFAQTIQFVNPTMLMMPYAVVLYATKV